MNNGLLGFPAGGGGGAEILGLGYGQTWQNATGSRALATTYYNTTGKPIAVSVYGASATAGGTLSLTIGGIVIAQHSQAPSVNGSTIYGVVPIGYSYSVASSGTSPTFTWSELR